MSSAVGCIVLAAGSSRRFGSDKRRYTLPSGATVLAQTLATLQPLFSLRVLVLKPGDEDLATLHGNDWDIVLASDAHLGMGHSLAAAMPAITDWQGAVIALADMPWLQTASITRIRDAVANDALVVPYYQEQRGNPVGVGREYFGQLVGLQGDSGARQLFQQFSHKITRLQLDDPGLIQDLDTPP